MRSPISVRLGDHVYTGWYIVEDGMVTVASTGKLKRAPLDGIPADLLAQLLLADLVRARSDSSLER
jgi:hypothetical protein